MPLLRRGAALITLVAASALALTGCFPSAQEDAQASLTDFLDALRGGDFAAAVSLSTSDPADFACEAMRSDGGDIAIAAPEVRRLEVDGDHATAEVDYRSPDPATMELEMLRVDGQWRVELPEDFRIELAFDDLTVGEVVVDDECRVPVQDGRAELLAWPGFYRIDIEDPTGVVTHFGSLYSVPDHEMLGGDPLALPAVPQNALTDVQLAARPLLEEAMASCRPHGGVARADCPGQFSGVTLAEDSRRPSFYLDVERVWTEDGEQWRFETRESTIDVMRGGVPEQIDFRFAGTLDTDSSGELRIELDPTI